MSALMAPATIRIASVDPTSSAVPEELQVDQRGRLSPLDHDEQHRAHDG